MTREEARDQIVIFMCDEQKVINDRDKQALDMAIQALEQEPKTGHWIDGGEYICFGGRQKAPCICSVCRKSALNEQWYYCPNCGARMVEPQESEG